MKSSIGYLKLSKKLFILAYLAMHSSLGHASLQATSIPTFDLAIHNYNQQHTEIISFCVYNTDAEGNLNYRVNVCTPRQINNLFASTAPEAPLKFQLFWKDKKGRFEELSPCSLNGTIFTASNEFNCGGKENVQIKLVIEPSWIQEAEAGQQRIPLSINLYPA